MLPKFILGLGAMAGLGVGAELKVWTSNLDAKPGSAITGSARVEAIGADSAGARINVTGAKPNGSLTWGIHSGKCSAPGAMFDKQEAYQVIQTDSTGLGSATATLALTLTAGGDYSVVVHGGSGNSMGACGDLRESGT